MRRCFLALALAAACTPAPRPEVVPVVEVVATTSAAPEEAPDPAPERPDVLFVAGVGLERFPLGPTKRSDVETVLGNPARVIAHGGYSLQLIYASGLSFYVCQSDDQAHVFAVEVDPPAPAHTAEGIVLGKSTMRDVIARYGEGSWSSGQDSARWTLSYSGIDFEVDREMSVPQYPLDEELHLDRLVAAFSLTFRGRDGGAPIYQCGEPWPEP